MDVKQDVTVTRLDLCGEKCYLLIGWQNLSFEMFLYVKEMLWRGTFTSSRLSGFSQNLQMTEEAYYKSLKSCLAQKRTDYRYELKNGFFYWTRKLEDSVLIEGFLPVEVDHSPKKTQPDLIEVLLALNNRLNKRANLLLNKYSVIREDYQKCLKDTEEFLNLKIEMEKALCVKFLSLIKLQKSKILGIFEEANESDKKVEAQTKHIEIVTRNKIH